MRDSDGRGNTWDISMVNLGVRAIAKLKLTDAMITEIAAYRRINLTWTEIAGLVGVTYETLRVWRGKVATSRDKKFKDLGKAIEEAEARKLELPSTVLFDYLAHGSRTTTTKTITDANGISREEKTVKEEGPDPRIALSVLERLNPVGWGRVHQTTWRGKFEAQGVNPKDAARSFLQALGNQQTGQAELADTDDSPLDVSVYEYQQDEIERLERELAEARSVEVSDE